MFVADVGDARSRHGVDVSDARIALGATLVGRGTARR